MYNTWRLVQHLHAVCLLGFHASFGFHVAWVWKKPWLHLKLIWSKSFNLLQPLCDPGMCQFLKGLKGWSMKLWIYHNALISSCGFIQEGVIGLPFVKIFSLNMCCKIAAWYQRNHKFACLQDSYSTLCCMWIAKLHNLSLVRGEWMCAQHPATTSYIQ